MCYGPVIRCWSYAGPRHQNFNFIFFPVQPKRTPSSSCGTQWPEGLLLGLFPTTCAKQSSMVCLEN